jgi:hypothetical protein
MRIRDTGWKKFGPRIRDKHPGTLNLPYVKAEDHKEMSFICDD